ncbi:hypothetical protein EV702DRAFT_1246687 [Suillus placidus]|uniref:acetate--CoA ligase n=1 Tax=Suillus placidus TaxID=48579 RepID=A0A9P6ZMX8_9AGAM|nr:hypothetical protein EV702DRAFT_1246687 [Suillus placidus]
MTSAALVTSSLASCVKTAIIYEASDKPEDGCFVTYSELLREVCSIANVLKALGVKKGDTVSVFLPTTWQSVAAFLTCSQIGAVHSAVFAGFSVESLRDRIQDCKSRVVLTSDEGRRGGKRTGGQVPWVDGRDKWWHEETAKVPSYCPPEIMSSEDPLFILYTSGSTGKPKGVVHTTGGYFLCAALTVKYGVYPTPSRHWQTVQKHQLTQFYSAPTAIRLLRRLSAQHVENHDLSRLRVLGSVGEPTINPDSEAWNWYNEHVGKKQCTIVDTFWQTETGSIVVTPFPGAIETKPASATVPFFGIEPAILDPVSGKELEGNNVEGVLVIKQPWPSIARSVHNDRSRYLEMYMKPYGGVFYTGDGAARDEHCYIWIKGRIDDVINISRHCSSTPEIESTLIMHRGVAETAVIGTADELTGQAVVAFVTLKPEFTYDHNDEASLAKELVLQVRKVIGPFVAPKKIFIIMCRIMRKIIAGEGDQLGDLSTVAEPGVVDVIKKKVAEST